MRRLPVLPPDPPEPAARTSGPARLVGKARQKLRYLRFVPYLARIGRWALWRAWRRAQGKRGVDPSQPFCPSPFEWFELDPKGRAYLCCSGWLPLPIGDLNRSRPEKIWNSLRARLVRAAILDGSFAFCDQGRCPRLTRGDLPRAGDMTDERLVRAIAEESTSLPSRPRTLNLGYDRTCNLSCPSCRSELVTANEEVRARANRFHDELFDWMGRELENVKVTGSGDPFASPVYRKLLAGLDPAVHPKLAVILHTNGLLLTPHVWESVQRLHGRISLLEVSIDAATAETYRVVRRGGDFEILRERLAFIRDQRKAARIQSLLLSFVVQDRNYREMPDFVRMALEVGSDRIQFTALFDWGTYGPGEYLQRAVHLPTHPEHGRFLEVLADPIMRHPAVYQANLAPGATS